MMRQQPVIDRLDGIGLVTRGAVLEWAGQITVPGRLPAGFVVPAPELAGANRMDHGIDQRVEAGWNVMLVLAGNTRAGVDELLVEMVGKICGRLLGWTHPDASGPTSYAGGELASLEAGSLVWRVGFRSPYHLRSV